MAPVTVTMPLELTVDMLRAVRLNPMTSTDDKDEENRRTGWLICAWDVLVSKRLPPNTTADHQQTRRRESMEWQPIETAPDDMTEPVMVFWIDSDGAPIREFDYKEDACWMGWHEHAEHVHVIGGHGVSYTPPYTHWMPLPPPPAA